MSILISLLLFYTVIEHSVMVSARGCPGSTCISPLWLDRCKLSLSLSLDVPGDVLAAPASALCGWTGVNSLSLPPPPPYACLLVAVFSPVHSQKLHLLATVVYYFPMRTMPIIGSNHLISQTGWNRCEISLSLSLSLSRYLSRLQGLLGPARSCPGRTFNQPCGGWIGVISLSLL